MFWFWDEDFWKDEKFYPAELFGKRGSNKAITLLSWSSVYWSSLVQRLFTPGYEYHARQRQAKQAREMVYSCQDLTSAEGCEGDFETYLRGLYRLENCNAGFQT
jgi:hypothetical protein